MAKKQMKLKSGFEKKVASHLQQNKIPFEYESLRVPYEVPVKRRTYNPDFMLPNGVIIEAKGKLDREVREKMALVMEQNPHLDIRILFMRDNKIAKNSKTRYSDWCKKRGIKYAVSEDGVIPEDWVKDALAVSSLDATAGVQYSSTRLRRGRKVRDPVRSLDSVRNEEEQGNSN